MTWPTDEERRCCFGTCGGDRQQHAPHEDVGCSMFEDMLRYLAPHVAALVRAERAAALREARDAYPAMLRDMVSRGSVRRFLDARAEAEEAGR